MRFPFSVKIRVLLIWQSGASRLKQNNAYNFKILAFVDN